MVSWLWGCPVTPLPSRHLHLKAPVQACPLAARHDTGQDCPLHLLPACKVLTTTTKCPSALPQALIDYPGLQKIDPAYALPVETVQRIKARQQAGRRADVMQVTNS